MRQTLFQEMKQVQDMRSGGSCGQPGNRGEFIMKETLLSDTSRSFVSDSPRILDESLSSVGMTVPPKPPELEAMLKASSPEGAIQGPRVHAHRGVAPAQPSPETTVHSPWSFPGSRQFPRGRGPALAVSAASQSPGFLPHPNQNIRISSTRGEKAPTICTKIISPADGQVRYKPRTLNRDRTGRQVRYKPRTLNRDRTDGQVRYKPRTLNRDRTGSQVRYKPRTLNRDRTGGQVRCKPRTLNRDRTGGQVRYKPRTLNRDRTGGQVRCKPRTLNRDRTGGQVRYKPRTLNRDRTEDRCDTNPELSTRTRQFFHDRNNSPLLRLGPLSPGAWPAKTHILR
ncbi:hypothetical protein P7K49_009000 [Saguinus oedipus]|uniref:Uncharacterized protein n=1 Tax=Saguinus oedipus TaxID=9490 RepID=A0ABQ9VZB6_SAGOE|nr:hypothetical protein P7K49_009000 [Saguinus oedipus]